jgi:ADP-ribose pyrophosphatase
MGDRLLKTAIFDVEGFEVQTRAGERTYYRLHAPDWVNIVPITQEGKVVLIRQHRWGVDAETLEIPGGMVDPGESPEEGGVRELVEETGYGGGRVISLGWMHPNPAIQGNKCWMYAMLDAVVVGETQFDAGEDIEVELVDLSELPGLLDRGAISHALAIVSLQRVLARWPDVG